MYLITGDDNIIMDNLYHILTWTNIIIIIRCYHKLSVHIVCCSHISICKPEKFIFITKAAFDENCCDVKKTNIQPNLSLPEISLKFMRKLLEQDSRLKSQKFKWTHEDQHVTTETWNCFGLFSYKWSSQTDKNNRFKKNRITNVNYK